MQYRPDIDGLRAVAVSTVVLSHAGLGFPGGYVGVDVFFVISGYLITRLMLDETKNGTFSLAGFYERRIRRILPAMFVVTAASLVAGFFLLVPKSYQLLGQSVVSLSLLRSNLFFSRQTDYFAASVEELPLLHTWSLAVEEQFYLFLPVILWGATRLRRQSWLGPLVGLLAVASFGYGIYGTAMWSQQAYYLLSTRVWELLAGTLTAMYLCDSLRVGRGVREVATLTGLAGIVLPGLLYDEHTPFPGIAALSPVLGTMLLVVFGGRAQTPTLTYRLLSSRAAVGLGLISYSLYLWHWPLIVLVKHHSDLLVTMLGRGMLVVASAALALVTYRYVEQPFRRRDFLASRRHLIAAAGAVFIGLLGCGELLHQSEGVVERLPQQARQLARTDDWPDESFARLIQAADVPRDLPCIGAADREPRVLIWGDSHLFVLLPVLHESFQAAGVAARCAVCPGRAPTVCAAGPAPGASPEPDAFGAAVMEYAKSPEIRVVLLAAFWSTYYSRPEFADSFEQTVDALRAAGKDVYFLKDVPNHGHDVAAALVRCAWRGRDVRQLAFAFQDYEVQNPYHQTHLPSLVERGLKVLDPIPYLCGRSDGTTIPACDAGGSFYRDQDHLSQHGARTIQPVFAPLIDEVVSSSARDSTADPRLTAEGVKPDARLR